MAWGALLLGGAVTGLGLQLRQPALWSGWEYGALGLCGAALLAAAVVGCCLRHQSVFHWHMAARVAAAVGVALLAFAWAGGRAAWFNAGAMPPQWHGMDVRVQGVVAAMPRWNTDGVRFRFAPERAERLDGTSLELPQLMDVSWYAAERFGTAGQSPTQPLDETAARCAVRERLPDLQPGDRLALVVRLRVPHGSFNPPLFDYEQWLWQQSVQATAYVRQGPAVEEPVVLGHTGRYRLQRWRHLVRERIQRALLAPRAWQATTGAQLAAPTVANPPCLKDQTLRMRSTGVLAALVTGEQRAIEQEDWEVFRITGVAHLMAISGLHITMFAAFAMAVVGRVWRRSTHLMHACPAPLAARWGGLALAALYALFSGWGVPAQRTVWMLATWVVVQSLGVRWPWHATLMLAAAVVLTIDPWALQQAGFWLSFVAVAVLMVLASDTTGSPDRRATAAQAVLPRRGGLQVLWHAACRACSQLWQLQWRLSLVLVPLTVALFGQVAWVGLIANLVAIPVVTAVVTPLAMLGAIVPVLLPLPAWTMERLLQFLQWLARWPAAELMWPQVPWGWALVGLAGAIVMVGRWPPWLRLQGAVCLGAMLLWRPPLPPAGEFHLTALDVGQGSAVLVQTHRHTLLYDTGPRYSAWRDAGQSVVVPYLHARGLRPDLLVLSHIDSDHTGGAASVLEAFSATAVLPVLAPFAADQWLSRQAAPDQGALTLDGWRQCAAGLQWQWDGVTFEVLYPDAMQLERWRSAEAAGRAAVPTNATSCVLRVRSASGRTALLTGDIGRLEEFELVRRSGAELAADWLLVPHHGSRGGTSERFVSAVTPRFAVVQAGFRNQFNHPHPAVVQRLQSRSATVLTTPQCGALQWSSARPQEMVCSREVRRRSWHRPPQALWQAR
ncbi:hypothetical protein AAV94_04820 [Lampropedia cohaerens]|uniref:Metallo-beta-lactamase domain-containing protein n=1 Tax=Lampropedia cohaerens TaxID=1610491 RepID=A0A0U1Q0Z5_9BURK|nr:DNA internalization-related competence protein ComEC/Rec2 [Lampropedia cohaerens]KKW68433.1 hypothetical protein AAV94_04820 [Lampropedia cohaerens]